MKYIVTGIFNDDSMFHNETVDFSRKADVIECIRGNLSRENFDTIVIRRIEE